MPPMLGAVWLWMSSFVLWWSGWREEAADGIPHWAVGVFLAGWPFFLLWNLKLSFSLSINGAWIWIFTAFLTLAYSMQANRRWTALSSGVLLGSIYVLINRLSNYPSALSHYIAPWSSSIAVGLLAALLLRDASEQLVAVSLAIFLSDGISTLFLLGATESIVQYQPMKGIEAWWIAILFARLWTFTVRLMKIQTRKFGLKMGWK